MTVYADQYMYPLYCSFPGLISQMPATEYHMKRVCAWVREYRYGDYTGGSIPFDDLMVPSNSNYGSPEGLDEIGERNLENITEG